MASKQQTKVIKTTIDLLNKIYPTNYTDRLNHHYNFFKKKLGQEYEKNYYNINIHIVNIVKDKDVTFEIIEQNSHIMANAHKSNNVIQFNPKMFDKKEFYGSGYKREHKLMNLNVLNNKQYLTWITIHEYCHLLYPSLGHTNTFFGKVEEIYKSIQ